MTQRIVIVFVCTLLTVFVTSCAGEDPATQPLASDAEPMAPPMDVVPLPDGDTGGEPAALPPSPTTTYYDHIAPILAKRCLGCHAGGDPGQPTLASYEEASGLAGLILAAVQSGNMPKWRPSEDCLELEKPLTVPADEIALIETWIAEGTPAGEKKPVVLEESWEAAEWDIPLVMAGEFESSTTEADELICFVLDPQNTTDQFITGYEFFPGNNKIDHHALFYVDENRASQDLITNPDLNSYICPGGPQVESKVFGGWVPGSTRANLPDGTGFRLPAGSVIVLQMHYHSAYDPGSTDQSRLGLNTAEAVDNEMFFRSLANHSISIPADAQDWQESKDFPMDFGVDIDLHAIAPHMHLVGTSTSLSHHTSDGTERCLMSIDDWEFDEQNVYWLAGPERIADGDTVTLECTYDNTMANPNQPSTPPLDVTWGEGTEDEMCITYIAYTIAK